MAKIELKGEHIDGAFAIQVDTEGKTSDLVRMIGTAILSIAENCAVQSGGETDETLASIVTQVVIESKKALIRRNEGKCQRLRKIEKEEDNFTS